MGAAGQNIIFSIVLVMAIFTFGLESSTTSSRQQLLHRTRRRLRPYSAYFFLYFMFVAWTIAATLIQGEPQTDHWLGHALGLLSPLLLPISLAVLAHNSSEDLWARLQAWVQVVAIVLGVVAMSQWIFGWQFFGGRLHFREYRAYGFHSHPLTFSYVLLLMAPLLVGWALTDRRPLSIAGTMGVAAGILAALSRTVQAVFALEVVAMSWRRTHGRGRRRILVGAAVVGLVLSVFENPIRRKFIGTIHRTQDVQSDYPDDRLAFWHAHWTLIRQSPFIGHGPHYSETLLHRAYADIGLGAFTKKYSAHNTFLQVLTEFGAIGLLLFLGFWLALLMATFRQAMQKPWLAGFSVAWLGFLLGSLTQNAFQDSEVRGAFSVVLAWLIVSGDRAAPSTAV